MQVFCCPPGLSLQPGHLAGKDTCSSMPLWLHLQMQTFVPASCSFKQHNEAGPQKMA